MKKVVRDGQVAILYSPGYGAGWYTFHDCLELVFHPRLVELVENDQGDLITPELVRELLEISPDSDYLPYLEAAKDLAIKWLPEGTEFRIEEYDGAETVLTPDQLTWLIA